MFRSTPGGRRRRIGSYDPPTTNRERLHARASIEQTQARRSQQRQQNGVAAPFTKIRRGRHSRRHSAELPLTIFGRKRKGGWMAIRKAARAKSTAARAGSANKTTKKPSKRQSAAARRNRRKSQPETLRLRSMNPLFTVADLERSVRFYTDVLGFIVGRRYTGSDGTLQGVMLKAGICDLGLSQDDWAKGR